MRRYLVVLHFLYYSTAALASFEIIHGVRASTVPSRSHSHQRRLRTQELCTLTDTVRGVLLLELRRNDAAMLRAPREEGGLPRPLRQGVPCTSFLFLLLLLLLLLLVPPGVRVHGQGGYHSWLVCRRCVSPTIKARCSPLLFSSLFLLAVRVRGVEKKNGEKRKRNRKREMTKPERKKRPRRLLRGCVVQESARKSLCRAGRSAVQVNRSERRHRRGPDTSSVIHPSARVPKSSSIHQRRCARAKKKITERTSSSLLL